MNKMLFKIMVFGIAILGLFTGEIATVLMLYFIFIILSAIHSTIEDFYADWKRKNINNHQ